jgi:hypothetical protein
MKKLVYYVIASTILLYSCTKEGKEEPGNIYGVVTNKTTIEPMRGTGVELYAGNENGKYSLLTRTVTYDDGHYEFNNLKAGNYMLKVEADGYEKTEYNVVVESGRTAKGDMQLVKINTYMTVRTLDVTDIRGNSATLNGSYSVTQMDFLPNEVGFVYAAHSSPANVGTKITASNSEKFSTTITDLSKGTYYVQAYVKNSLGTEYGEERNFQITGAPSVSTLPVTNVTAKTATLNGKIDYQGDPACTERGFVYSNTFQNPTVEDDTHATTKIAVSGTSMDFSANVANLKAEKTYYVRAYATNSNGTVYGESLTTTVDFIVLQSEGIMVQKNDISSGSTWHNAVSLCENSTVAGKTDWRLPTRGELQALYNNRIAIGGFSSSKYWSSDYRDDYDYYYYFNFDIERVGYNDPDASYRVRAVRTLP